MTSAAGEDPPSTVPPVPVPALPALRIISLVPSLTETLFALELGPHVIGVSRYCDYPEAAKVLPKVGGLFDRNFEQIVTLRPTHVVVMDEGPEPLGKLRNLGPAVVVVRQETINDIYESIRLLGGTFHAEQRASVLVADLKAQVAQIRARVSGEKPKTVLLSLGGERGTAELVNTIIASKQTYLGELLELAGGVNAYTGTVPYPTISAEGVIALDPEAAIELIPEGQANAPSEQAVRAAWNRLHHLRAVRNNQIHILRNEYTVNPGPRFVLTLRDIASILHPATMPQQ